MNDMQEFVTIGLMPNLAKCFVPLPQAIEPSDEPSPESLYHAFRQVFRAPEAKAGRDVVFVWTVDRPYTHDQGKNSTSRFVYIEKTKSTMWARWSNENLRRVTTDFDDRDIDCAPSSIRAYADANRNFTFYRHLVRDHGPLRIWWASSEVLNEAAGSSGHNSEAWEGHLLALYLEKHGCRPLKNRRGGRLLKDV